MTTIRAALLTGLYFSLSAALLAQPPGFTPSVSYTEAINHDVRSSLELTGSVAAYRSSVVAASIAGVIVELRARDGQAVRRGNTLARLRPDTFELQLQAAEGQLVEARARLKLAEARRERARGLWDEQVISRQELDDAMTEVEAGEGRVAQLEADVGRFKDELERTVVRAPFDGVVVAEHTAVGEWVSAGDPVVEVLDVSDLEVTLAVPERYFGGIEVGAEVAVSIAAQAGLEITGKVRSIVPKADPQARTFPVKVSIPSAGGKVGAGMLASVRLPIGEPRAQVLVPKDAVVAQGTRRYVLVMNDDDTVRQVDVRLGSGHGAWVAVTGEVAADDRVITQGNERLAPGAKVNAQRKDFEQP